MAGMKNMGLVLVEFEFKYVDRDGDPVSIKPNERYILLSKTNDHWWQVCKDDCAKPFYIPAMYVKELPSDLPLPLDFMEPAIQVVAEPRHNKTVTDVAGDRRDEVTIRARPQNHYKKAENRMSTFGVPLDVHGSAFHWGGLSDSSVALQPHEHVPVTPGHSRDSPQHAKRPGPAPSLLPRPGPAPSSLLSPQSHSEDQLHISQKSWVPSFSLTDPVVKQSQAGQVEPPIIKDVPVTPLVQECEDKAKPPAKHLEATRVDSKKPSISDVEGLQPKDLPVSEFGLFVTPPPAPTQPPPPPPSSQVDNDGPSASLYASVMDLKMNIPQTTTPASFTSSSLHQNPGMNPFSTPMDQDLIPDMLSSSDLFISTPPPPSYPAPLGPDVKLALDGPAGQHFQIRLPAEPQDQQRGQDNVPPPLPKEDYPADAHGSQGSQELEFLMSQKDYSPSWSMGIPRASVDPGTLTSWGRTPDPRGKTAVSSVPQHEQLPILSNPPKLGNGTEDAVPVMKNWRHTLGPSYFAGAPEEANFIPSHRRKVSDYTNELPSLGSSGELHHHTHALEKVGIVNKTKVFENGKRLRKNWSQSWTVLHGGILTFHKDPKSAPTGASKSSQIVPEYTVDLRGATICKAPKEKSSKKNVLEIRTRNGSEYLMQYDTDTIISDWYKVIEDTIRQLDLNHHSEDDGEESSDKSPGPTDKDDKEKKKFSNKSSPAVSSVPAELEQGRVRNKLRKFLLRRPTLQAVKEKGYIRDNVFGCQLSVLCHRENTTVPSFVEKCIASVEKRGLDIDGIYRVSGNLAVIQKLRYKADHEENLDLEDGQWEEIHVITGALKLFFRELPEPLFPFSLFDRFIAAIRLQDYSQKVSYICDLVKSLPLPNHDTMKLLFQHLRKVIEFRDVNRMSVQSIAIVFGPTLLWPETESSNITLHMVYQTQIVELILNQFDHIFQSN